MDTLKCCIFSLILVTSAWAQVPPQPCVDALAWDYPPNDPTLGWFHVYVSEQSGLYPIVPKNPVKSRPTVSVLAVPTMVLTVTCAQLRLRGVGPWYAVVTSVSLDMSEESKPSNELVIGGFPTSPPVKPTPLPPAQPPGKPPVNLPPPLAHAVRPTSPVPSTALSGLGRGGGLTDTDVWQGIGATPPPPLRRDVPGAP